MAAAFLATLGASLGIAGPAQPDLGPGATLALPLGPAARQGVDAFAAGRFLDDGRQHVAQLVGGRVVLRFGPDAFRADERIGVAQHGVNDVATLPRSERDELLTIGRDGLEAVRYDPIAGEFVAVPLAGGPWADGRSLVVDDLDADGQLDVAAVAGDGRSVVVLRGVAGGGWTSAGTWDFGVGVEHLTSLDWSPSQPGPELVAAHGSMLTFANLSTLWTAVLPSPVPLREVLGVREAGHGNDALVVLLELPGTRWLAALAQDRLWPGRPLDASTTALLAADVDGDGSDDLLVQYGDGERVELHAFGDAASPVGWTPYSGTPTELAVPAEVPLGDGPPAPLLVEDLDQDGDLDVYFQRTGAGHALLVRGGLVDETQAKSLLPYISFHADPLVGDVECVAFTLWAPPPAWATHFELTVWRGDRETTEEVPVYARREPLAVALGAGFFEFRLPEATTTFDTHYGLVLRYVECLSTGLGRSGVDAVYTIEGHSGIGSTGHNPRPPLPAMPRIPDPVQFGLQAGH